MGSSFGTLFRVTTWGESHGPSVGVVVDGCPPRLALTEGDIQRDLDRRRPGQSSIVTQRRESDTVRILSGVLDGYTLGTPIALEVRNEDARSRDYEEMREKYRPSHADFTYDRKFGIRAWMGGGRASARETIGRVAAGAVARKWLFERFGVEIVAWVEKVHTLRVDVDPMSVTLDQVESNPIRCPDPQAAERFLGRVEEARKNGDSVGGIVGCVARNCPAGWGDQVFDKLEADLAKAMLSLPAKPSRSGGLSGPLVLQMMTSLAPVPSAQAASALRADVMNIRWTLPLSINNITARKR
jgi:chorismate synthase